MRAAYRRSNLLTNFVYSVFPEIATSWRTRRLRLGATPRYDRMPRREHTQFIYRPLDEMKPRNQFIIIIGLVILILAVAWYTFPDRKQILTQTLPATIQHDCAPWDGAAFTVSIPPQGQGGDSISISIWQAPELTFPKTFSFPDNTGQVGNASLMRSSGSAEQLSGSVFFSSVNQESPVDGRFELSTSAGQRFAGEFHAEWDDQIVMCG